MKIYHHNFSAISLGLLVALSTYIPLNAHASGAGTISNEPLFTTLSVEPNVFFMLDDSGSMDSDMLTPYFSPSFISGATGGYVVFSSAGREYYWSYSIDVSDNQFNNEFLPPQENADALGGNAATTMAGVWRGRNHNFNVTYYNPNIDYLPWGGEDINGLAYGNADPLAARINAYNPSSGTVNLTLNQSGTTRRPSESGESGSSRSMSYNYFPARYWVWEEDTVDSETTDGVDSFVNTNDRHTLVEIKPSNECSTGQNPLDNGCFIRSYNDEIQNFANWWQYHRRREYAMKFAVSNVIAPSTGTRMGMSTINASSSEEREIASMNSEVGSGNKRLLLRTLFTVQSGSGTPLETALNSAGDYYECRNDNNLFGNTNCPIQTNVVPPATQAAGVCQSNFTILLTDGFLTDSISGIGNADGDSSSYTDGGVTYRFGGNPYSDSRSNTLADIAQHYYERDLADGSNSSPDLENRVPTQCGVDENPGQHMVTYTISFGLEGALDPETQIPNHPRRGLVDDCADETGSAPSVAWTNPSSDAGKIDELLHAAYNGRGAFFSANDPTALTNSLNNTLSNIADRTSGTGSGVAFNASTLGTDSSLYLAQFDTNRWSGDVLSFDIIDQEDIDNGSTLPLGSVGNLNWSAANVLDNTTPWANRNIWSHKGELAGSNGITFEWAQLSATQQADLNTGPSGADGLGQQRLNFIHGDRSQESQNSGNFRERDSALGDIIGSGAIFVGIPSLGWPDTAPFPEPATAESYSEFRSRLSDPDRGPTGSGPVVGVDSLRTEMVYVGANDGMLHAFQASNGQEQFAYIPSYVYSSTANEGLHYLTDPAYTHRFGHDLTPTISDVYTPDSGTDSSWKTILIGGHRAGAKGFFALDITDPSSFNTTNPVLWEFRGETGPDASHPLGDPDLGYSFSKPTIVLTNEIKNGNHRWAAVFGNGYNQSGNGQAQLFIVYLDPSLGDGWTEGDDYIKISTTSDGSINGGSSISPNGLSTPALVDLNGDGTVDRAYAGDLAGDMWAFDLCDRNTDTGACGNDTSWGVAHKDAGTNAPLFNGPRDGSNNPTQPITTQPQIIRNPQIANSDTNRPNLIVLFGTGRYISNGDNLNQDNQTFYGIWDEGTGNRNLTHLEPQTFLSPAGSDDRVTSDNQPNYAGISGSTDYGWYLNLPAAGERSVTDAVVRNNIVFFSTTIPSPNPCDDGGSGFIMFLDAVTGGRPSESVFDFDGDGDVDLSDRITIGGSGSEVGTGSAFDGGLPSSPSFLGDTIYVAGTESATGADIDTNAVGSLNPEAEGRLSWGELQQELFELSTPPSP